MGLLDPFGIWMDLSYFFSHNFRRKLCVLFLRQHLDFYTFSFGGDGLGKSMCTYRFPWKPTSWWNSESRQDEIAALEAGGGGMIEVGLEVCFSSCWCGFQSFFWGPETSPCIPRWLRTFPRSSVGLLSFRLWGSRPFGRPLYSWGLVAHTSWSATFPALGFLVRCERDYFSIETHGDLGTHFRKPPCIHHRDPFLANSVYQGTWCWR